MPSARDTAANSFIVLYRWRLRPGTESAFIAGWSRITELLRDRGSLGSRLHQGSDGLWYSYAQWPSAQARTDTFALGSLDAAASAQMHASIAESLPEIVVTLSHSGKGQRIARCPDCRVAVWSHYAGSGELTTCVRVGTLDNPDLLPPDVHIFTASRQSWVPLPEDALAFGAFYDPQDVLSENSLARFRALRSPS